ncbi:MAG: monovalent cation/H(+) antiporter subunit G [Bacteroidales bacterium]|nr:monovalent cation/H(+) antiporter subunit G [Bacteroidales bacterium]
MISEWIAGILLVSGAFFMLIASIGMVRLNDLYMRMHASTKAPSLGIFLMVMSIIVYFFKFWTSFEGLIILFFVFLTTPVGSHMISSVAHSMGVKKDENTIVDEMEEESSLKKEIGSFGKKSGKF